MIIKGNDQQLKQFFFKTNSHCQHLNKCIVSSMENMHTDIGVNIGLTTS